MQSHYSCTIRQNSSSKAFVRAHSKKAKVVVPYEAKIVPMPVAVNQ